MVGSCSHQAAVGMASAVLYQPPPVYFRPATACDLTRIAELEAECFPADEAESADIMAARIAEAPGLFLVAVRQQEGNTPQDEVVGFMCGTLTTGSRLTKACMGRHEAQGGVACVHSVCVTAAARRSGVATRMVNAYLAYIQHTAPELRETRLLSKKHLVPWYMKLGFGLVGPSEVVHGSEPWFEMVYPKLCQVEA